MQPLDIEIIRDYVSRQDSSTKVYIGCDSVKYKKYDQKTQKKEWFAAYTTVVVVHKSGRNGAAVFGETVFERDYDQNKSRPSMRLMNEVTKAIDVFNRISDIVDEREIEIHLDINPDEKYGSSCVVSQAVGYVRGVTGLEPKIKPESFVATHCADHFARKYKPHKNRKKGKRK